MTTGPDDTSYRDPAAALVAVLVGLHCLAARWLPSALGGNAAHVAVALLVVGISGPVIVGGWMKHLESRVWSWAVLGWLGLLLARAGSGRGLNEGAEVVVTVVSCGLLVVAHLLNRSLAYWYDRS